MQAYYDYMVDMAVIFGADKERAKQEFRDVIAFETSLAKVCSKINVITDDSSETFIWKKIFFCILDFNANGTTS